MRGIKLKDSIKLMGFTDGFNFWFRWSFFDPIKIFWWKYITAKPFCIQHGYFLCNPNCQYEKITGRKNILDYHKKRNQQLEVESKTIRGYDEGKCAYCGDPGTEIIDDPNWDTLERWLVCETCKEVIELQRESSYQNILPTTFLEQEKINDRLLEIAKQTGKPIMTTVINKKGVSSITYGK